MILVLIFELIFCVFNNKYRTTNMVYSLFKAKKFIKKNEDLVICYSDIIFSHQIYDLFEKNKKTFIPVKKNWLILGLKCFIFAKKK